MNLVLHLPREHEASILPPQGQNIEITPKFYRQEGWENLMVISTTTRRNVSKQYMMQVNARTGAIRLTLMEVITPKFDNVNEEEETVETTESADKTTSDN